MLLGTALCLLIGSLMFQIARADEKGMAAVEAWKYLAPSWAASVKQDYRRPNGDAAVSGRRMSIAGVPYDKGIGTHAPSELVIDLQGRHKKFTSMVGIDGGADSRGSVVFKVLIDGREAFASGVLRQGNPAKKIELNVTGAKELRLLTTDAGDGPGGDHADWAEARVDDSIVPKPVPAFSTAGFFAVPGSARTVASFNPGWRFFKGDAGGAEAPGFDDSNWERANLPHGLEILGENASGCRNYQGPAWYRKRFDAGANGGKVFLYFEAVMGKCAVWINGKKAAEHFGGYLPFAVDAGPLLKADGKGNIVAVRADNSDDASYPPGKPQNNLDFTYLGGIYRDTYLICTPETHVTLQELSPTVAGGGVFVGVKDVNGDRAEIEVRTEIVNDGKAAKSVALCSVLETAEGREVASVKTQVAIPAGEARQLRQNLAPKGVRLWHPDDPVLHFIHTELVENGKTVDSLKTRFGIRLFEMRGKEGLFVNKKFIGRKLNGVNRHQDYHFVGNALPNSGQWRDVKLLREGGNTMIRAAHYPMDPAFYDACDELGMLVTTANPGWQFFNFKDPNFEQLLFADTRALVRRDRNHPSMLLWETALNETADQPDRALKGMNKAANEEYPFPGFYTVADGGEAKRGGLNFYYHGDFSTNINSQTREYGDGGEVDNFGSQNASSRVKREWGESALLGQALIRARDLNGVFGTPAQRIGATLWCGIDHQRGYHPDPFWGGLLDGARIPRYSYWLFKSQYDSGYSAPGIATGPMIKIAHELTQISGPNVVVYSNCDEVRLTWLGKEIGPQKPDAGMPHVPHPPFTFWNVFDFGVIKKDWRARTGQIEMLAEGFINGRVVVRELKRYPERTTGISVIIDDAGIGLTADGADFVPVRATIVDNKGAPKVLAAEVVTFEVEGPGEIVSSAGTGTNPARTEFGTATALLRATKRAGLIKVRASAKGLVSGEALIASTESGLSLAYDEHYAATSKGPAQTAAAPVFQNTREGGDDVQKLRKELYRLQLELTSKEQDLMELRSRGHP